MLLVLILYSEVCTVAVACHINFIGNSGALLPYFISSGRRRSDVMNEHIPGNSLLIATGGAILGSEGAHSPSIIRHCNTSICDTTAGTR